ncbi:hypothetical protein K469DRAFT_686121 [Zopfia rhizophila CBS 207.26]|uniref:DUF7730 domain-containing protein n=1 Tax=Zopfia rhizophila CBS 207.26 TaxID=1314779 RepID=A0A6A6E510_9PEZI|nr:hypothetical protein K469DRAFT_686121 [Zopfia rhizophila CBS 207.26]
MNPLFGLFVLLTFDSAKKNQEQSPLLAMPPELRNKIFEYVYDGTNVFIAESVSLHASYRRCGRICYPTTAWVLSEGVTHPGPYAIRPANAKSLTLISGTCRQIYHETVMLPFAKCNFHFDNPIGYNSWMRDRLPVQRRSITTISPPIRTFRISLFKDLISLKTLLFATKFEHQVLTELE